MPKSTFNNLPEEKKQHITKAALGEFSVALYQDVSINWLIQSMGISTGSFYQYFEDKKDLYFHVLCTYMNSLLDESKRKNIKIDLLDREKNEQGTALFSDTHAMPYFDETFIKNYNMAPHNVKRDWSFDIMMCQKYMEIYDYSFFKENAVSEDICKNKELVMALVMAVPSVVSKFVQRESNPKEYKKLYNLCISVLKNGILAISEEEH